MCIFDLFLLCVWLVRRSYQSVAHFNRNEFFNEQRLWGKMVAKKTSNVDTFDVTKSAGLNLIKNAVWFKSVELFKRSRWHSVAFCVLYRSLAWNCFISPPNRIRYLQIFFSCVAQNRSRTEKKWMKSIRKCYKRLLIKKTEHLKKKITDKK